MFARTKTCTVAFTRHTEQQAWDLLFSGPKLCTLSHLKIRPVPPVPCKRKVEPWNFLCLQKFVGNLVNWGKTTGHPSWNKLPQRVRNKMQWELPRQNSKTNWNEDCLHFTSLTCKCGVQFGLKSYAWFEITSMISDQNCTTRSLIATLLDPFWNHTI